MPGYLETTADKFTFRIAAAGEPCAAVESRARRALQAALKYSLVANSVKSDIVMEPIIVIEEKANSHFEPQGKAAVKAL